MGLTLLALDTSTEACSVALLRAGKIFSRHCVSPREHTQRILPMVNRLLEESQCGLDEVEAIAFGRGPGSFTGIRIGIGIAQGLAFGANKPLIAISTLETLAQGAYRRSGAKNVVTAIDARMNQVYFGHYIYRRAGQWDKVQEEAVMDPDHVAAHVIANHGASLFSAGSGFETYPDMLRDVLFSGAILPEAQDMIPLAELAWHYRRLLQPEDVEPTYLRNEVTWKKLPGKE